LAVLPERLGRRVNGCLQRLAEREVPGVRAQRAASTWSSPLAPPRSRMSSCALSGCRSRSRRGPGPGARAGRPTLTQDHHTKLNKRL